MFARNCVALILGLGFALSAAAPASAHIIKPIIEKRLSNPNSLHAKHKHQKLMNGGHQLGQAFKGGKPCCP